MGGVRNSWVGVMATVVLDAGGASAYVEVKYDSDSQTGAVRRAALHRLKGSFSANCSVKIILNEVCCICDG